MYLPSMILTSLYIAALVCRCNNICVFEKGKGVKKVYNVLGVQTQILTVNNSYCRCIYLSVMAGNTFQGRHSRQPSKNTLLKVVILGDGGVGKSCLMNRFVSNHFDEHSFHTIGVEFLNKDIEINGEMYTLQIWDTAGQERFKSLRTPFYRGSDICLLTYAVDDRASFQNLDMWRNEFLYYADVKEGTAFPFLVVGNKVDMGEDHREVTTEEAHAWSSENGNLPHVETSAKDATNVKEAFSLAVESWAQLEAKLDRPYIGETVDLRRQQPEQRSSCCLYVAGNNE